jgi:hypothetical protein
MTLPTVNDSINGSFMPKQPNDWHWVSDRLPQNIVRVLNDRMRHEGFPAAFSDRMSLIDFAVAMAALVAVGGGMHSVADHEAIRDELVSGNG